jgi:peptidyl-prolyl cis-trans isomerase D
MLDILRSKSRNIVTYVLFGIIIVVFIVSFGPGSQGCQVTGLTQGYAVEVDGVVVDTEDYEQHYAQLFRTYQARVGQTFTRELADQLGLRNVAMNQLTDRALVLQDAKRRGLEVTDDELSRVIQSLPGFQTGGRFDKDLYARSVAASYGSAYRFEKALRDDLAYQKMIALLREGVQVSEDEVRRAWAEGADQVDLVLVRFPLASARKELKVSDADVKAFLASSAARVEKFYKDNATRWERKGRISARHVLVRVPEGAPAAQEDAARKKAEAIAERLAKGEDFAKVAKEASDDAATKDKGGDLGFFGPGEMAKPFEDAAFALKPGGLSAPVRTRFGWHVLRVDASEPARTVPLAEVRNAIAREILEEDGARKLADRRAREALAQAKAGKKLSDLFPATPPGDARGKAVAPKLGGDPLKAEDTGPFSRSGDFVPRVGAAPALAAAAFAASSAGQLLPDVQDTPTGPVVAQVKDRRRPDPSRYAAERDDVATQLRARRQAQVEAAWVKSLREGAKIKVNEALLRGPAPRPESAQ